MRRAARAALAVLFCISLCVAGWNGWQLASGGPAAALVARSAESLAASVDRAVAQAATPQAVTARLSELLAAEPRNWLAIEALEALAAERGIALPADIVARRAALHARDTGLLATSAACAACAWDPKACDFSAILLCRAPVDLTPIGDVAGVLREGGNLVLGREVDDVDLALSAIGLAAVALAPFTLGTSATIKVGAGMGKTAWRMGRLSDGLKAPLRHAAREGVDWSRLSSVNVFSRTAGDDFAALLRIDAVQPALDIVADAGRLHAALGPRRALYLLAQADTGAEARRIADVAEAMPSRSLGAFELLGKSRVLRASVRWADVAWFTLAGLAGIVAALAGLLWDIAGAVALRLLRRGAR